MANTTCRLWFSLLTSLIVAQGVHAMSSSAEGDVEFSFREAPYWVTITIPKSRDYFQSRAISEGGRSRSPGRVIIADIAFTLPGGGPPYTSLGLYIYERYKTKDKWVVYPINPTLQEFVVEYNLRNSQFFPSTDMPQLQARNVTTLRLGDRNWFKFNKWYLESETIQYVTIIDDKKMFVMDWTPPSDTFFHRNRSAKKQQEIERMLASVRISTDP